MSIQGSVQFSETFHPSRSLSQSRDTIVSPGSWNDQISFCTGEVLRLL